MMYASKNGAAVLHGDIVHGISNDAWKFIRVVDESNIIVSLPTDENIQYEMPASCFFMKIETIGAMA